MLKDGEVNLAGSLVPEGLARARHLIVSEERYKEILADPREIQEVYNRNEAAKQEMLDTMAFVHDKLTKPWNTEALRVAIAQSHRSNHFYIVHACLQVLAAVAYQGVDGRNIQAVESAKNLLLGDPIGKNMLDFPQVTLDAVDPSCPLLR